VSDRDAREAQHTAVTQHDLQPSGSSSGDPDGFLAPFGVRVDPELLTLALTHRSWAYEHDSAPHNERLEFLGDAILGQAVTVKLYAEHPELSEGDLSRRRAALVSSAALAEVARRIGVGEHVRLGIGEERSGGRDKESILADATEAIIGAVYLSTDPQTADRFVLELLAPLFADAARFSITLDPKTTVQEEADIRGVPRPSYEVVGEGPDHARHYTATVKLVGVTGRGEGISKKAAELAAARHAIEQLHAAGQLRSASKHD